MEKFKQKPSAGNVPSNADGRRQSKRFVEAAGELGADQPEEDFDEALRRIVTAPPMPKKAKSEK